MQTVVIEQPAGETLPGLQLGTGTETHDDALEIEVTLDHGAETHNDSFNFTPEISLGEETHSEELGLVETTLDLGDETYSDAFGVDTTMAHGEQTEDDLLGLVEINTPLGSETEDDVIIPELLPIFPQGNESYDQNSLAFTIGDIDTGLEAYNMGAMIAARIRSTGAFSFTAPFDGEYIIELWAGGAAGGGGSTLNAGAGGGGSAYVRGVVDLVGGVTYNGFVGAAGIGVGNGTGGAGTDSWFINTSTFLSKAGLGGSSSTLGGSGGQGGQASASVVPAGGVKFSGADGSTALAASGDGGGAAGPDANASGSTGVTPGGNGGASNVAPGSIIGGGGAGSNLALLGTTSGGNGARGEVRISFAEGDVSSDNLLTIQDVVVSEDGTNAVVTVTRASPSGTTSVNYSTSNRSTQITGDTAIVGADYTATSGTLTFLGASTSETFNIPLMGNAYPEPDRTGVVNLSTPVDGTISDGVGTFTIEDNDGTFTYLQDVSGNGYHLAAGTLATISADSPNPKFGKGRVFTATANETLTIANNAFAFTGSFCAIIAMNINAITGATNQHQYLRYGAANAGASSGTGSAFGFGQMTSVGSNQLRFSQDDGAGGQAFFNGPTATVGFHTYTIVRDAVAKTIVVKQDGIVIINATYTTDPVVAGGGVLAVGGRGDGNVNAASDSDIFEIRIWDHLVSQATLDTIVDNPGKSAPEGSELVFYRQQAL